MRSRISAAACASVWRAAVTALTAARAALMLGGGDDQAVLDWEAFLAPLAQTYTPCIVIALEMSIALGLLLRLCGSAGADHPDSFVRPHRFCPTYHNVHRLVIAALLVSVLGICLALVAALASAPIKRHPGSTKRKSE